jgi:hypothetical protein
VRKVKENTPFGKYANAAWAEWAERGAGGLQGVADRMGQNLNKIPFRIKIKFLNIPRLWKFA